MSVAVAHPQPGLVRSIWKLLRVSWLISFKSLTRARRGRLFGAILLGLLAFAIAGAVFAASWFLLDYLRSPELGLLLDAARLIQAVPAMVMGFAFAATLLFSFGLLLQGLYLVGDMEFLLSAPVPIRAVFGAKLIQAILPNVLLFSLFAVPLLFGLGASGGYNLLYYPLVLVELLATMLAAAGLASLLVMAIVRVFPARTVAEVLGAVGGIMVLLLSQAGNFGERFRLTQGQLTQGLNALTYLDSPWSPFGWAGRGPVDLGSGRWLSGAAFVALSLALSGAIFALTMTAAERLYFSGWTRIQSGTHKRKPARRNADTTTASPALAARRTAGLERLIPPAVRGVVLKDALILRRDLRSMSQLVSPLILGIIYAFAFVGGGGRPPPGRGEAPDWFMTLLKQLFVYGNAGIALFVGWMLMSRLALMGFSQEGRQYWLLKAAPVSPRQLLAAKFLVAYLPTVAIGWAFLLIISVLQGTGSGALLYGLLVVALCTAGGTGIFLAFGVAQAHMDWENPRQMVASSAGCISGLVGAAYIAVSLGLFFIPPIGLALLGQSQLVGQLIGLALGGAASLACVFVPLALVEGRVPRLGEA